MHTEEKADKTVQHPIHKIDGKSDKILETLSKAYLFQPQSLSMIFVYICLCMHAYKLLEGHEHTQTTFVVLLVISVKAFLLLCIYSRLVLGLLVALSQRQAVR